MKIYIYIYVCVCVCMYLYKGIYQKRESVKLQAFCIGFFQPFDLSEMSTLYEITNGGDKMPRKIK